MKTLKLAIEEACFLELDGIPTEKELKWQMPCSEEFEARMASLFQVKNRENIRLTSFRISKRFLLVAIIAAMLATSMCVQAVREPILTFAAEVYEKCTRIIYTNGDSTGDTIPVDERGFVTPNPPEGFEEIRRDEFSEVLEVEYLAADGRYLIYNQYKIEGAVLSIDTEGTQRKVVDVFGYDGFYFINKGLRNLGWSDGRYGYLVYGNSSFDVMYRFAQSICQQN